MPRSPQAEDADRELAMEMLDRYQSGESKSALEVEYWGDAASHGKRFTGFVRKHLGVETEAVSKQSKELDRLQKLLRRSGVSPSPAGDLSTEDRLVAKAREAALAAVRHYNDPTAGFKTEGFIVQMVIAWNCLLQAMLEKQRIDYFERDAAGKTVEIEGRAKVRSTWELVQLALADSKFKAVRCNLDFFLRLRHRVEHRYIPALDAAITAEAQAMLLNFEKLVVEEFGEEAGLGERLTVPLQLSALRSEAQIRSMKELQSQIPVDVMDFLTKHRSEVPDDVLRSPDYSLPIFFVPVTANRERAADAVVRFLRPGEVPPELEERLQKITVVTKTKQVPVLNVDLLRPQEALNLVSERLPYRFTMDTHIRCWKHYNVRPSSNSSEPAATNPEYCIYDKLSRSYGYTMRWVDFLVDELSDQQKYEEVVGVPPTPV